MGLVGYVHQWITGDSGSDGKDAELRPDLHGRRFEIAERCGETHFRDIEIELSATGPDGITLKRFPAAGIIFRTTPADWFSTGTQLHRAYQIRDNHVAAPPVMVEVDADEIAIEQAKQLADECDVELWEGARFVIDLRRWEGRALHQRLSQRPVIAGGAADDEQSAGDQAVWRVSGMAAV